ncbi:hypothetical protein EDD11_005178 [Mortierella claussenii]|nr:hypothetical protein EDD11_005178 [Mortierella claussenii]
MHKISSVVLLLLAALSLGSVDLVSAEEEAPQILSSMIDMDGIVAEFVFVPLADGSAQVTVDVRKGLTKTFAISPTGGFDYHIHVKPVGPNNDCMATGGHLDPTNIGAAKCVAAKADKCQEGDLSGKHGELKATDGGTIPMISYVDHQIQFKGENTTIAGRSVVIHNNGTRVACADILPMGTASKIAGSSDGKTGSSLPSSGSVEARTVPNGGKTVVWNTVMAIVGTAVAGLFGSLLGL